MLASQDGLRVLVSNIFFAPMSFGGATVVAENMAQELKYRHGWDVIVVASINDPAIPPYGVRRYATNGLDVIGVRVPEQNPYSEASWNNASFNRVFGEILERTKPDVVHAHCVQNMGATFFSEIVRRDIPLAVTVHDCWWLCERQFMINHAGRYCNQEKVDLAVCRYCVHDINATRHRTDSLRRELSKADLLLFPSRFHCDLHVANGFEARKCAVNKNGVRPPGKEFGSIRNADPAGAVRFGFVGGPGPIKGASLIQRAFNAIDRTDYELVVVDAARHAGKSWSNDPVWKIPGKVTVVPGYTQETMDDFFGGIDVLLFPSQWKESFGLTVREAMVRGVWVIATEAGGVAEDCIDGENATVLPFGSGYRELQQAIEAMFDDNRPRQRPIDHIALVQTQGAELSSYLETLAWKEKQGDARAVWR